MRLFYPLLFTLALSAAAALPAYGQNNLRLGVGPEGIANFFAKSISGSAIGVGGRARLSWALNEDFSVAFGSGVARFAGNDTLGTVHIFTPQLSLIIKLDDPNRFPYILLGVSGFGPFQDMLDTSGVHLGYGLVWPWGDRAFYAEVDPTLLFVENTTALVIPFRFGLIF